MGQLEDKLQSRRKKDILPFVKSVSSFVLIVYLTGTKHAPILHPLSNPHCTATTRTARRLDPLPLSVARVDKISSFGTERHALVPARGAGYDKVWEKFA